MAHSTLAALPTPNFHSAFERLTEIHLRCVDKLLAQQHLSPCDYEYAESSKYACDGVACVETATVSQIDSGREFCAEHFLEVSRG
jgi:hypothetical protein